MPGDLPVVILLDIIAQTNCGRIVKDMVCEY